MCVCVCVCVSVCGVCVAGVDLPNSPDITQPHLRSLYLINGM